MTTNVLYATMTGNSQAVAEETSNILAEWGVEHDLIQFVNSSRHDLHVENLIIVVPTYTNGDPPDEDEPALNEMLHGTTEDLRGTKFMILSLGDKAYTFDYCTFAPKLSAWLKQCGCDEVRPIIEVDNMDHKALGQWYHQVEDYVRIHE